MCSSGTWPDNRTASAIAPAATPPPRSPTQHQRSSPIKHHKPRRYDLLRKPAVLRRPLELGQYTSLAFGTTLRESGLVASMGRRGDAYDNAACESVISTIKNELIKRRSWTSRDQARLAVFSYIETFYNPRRRHSALGYRSPIEYENMTQQAPANTAAA